MKCVLLGRSNCGSGVAVLHGDGRVSLSLGHSVYEGTVATPLTDDELSAGCPGRKTLEFVWDDGRPGKFEISQALPGEGRAIVSRASVRMTPRAT